MKVIHEKNGKRIIEVEDQGIDFEALKGDCYDPDVNHDICPLVLKKQEIEFHLKVENEGVYGYELQTWDPSIGKGWETIDSCWGFVGTNEDENHYIVNEFKEIIDQEAS